MRKTLAAVVISIALASGLTGCGLFDPPKGTVVEKDYDRETYEEDENWDITVETRNGEVEWDVTERVFNACVVDDLNTPNREVGAYFNGKTCV